MSLENFHVRDKQRAELRRLLNAEIAKVSKGSIADNDEFDAFVAALSVSVSDGEEFQQHIKLPDTKPGVIAFLVPSTYYHVNVRRTSIWAIAILLDYLKTSGVITGLLAAHGLLKTALSRISPETGEFCNFIAAATLQKSGASINSTSIVSKIASKPCPYSELECEHQKNGVCMISLGDVGDNLEKLTEKGALEKERNRLRVPF